MTLLPPTEFTFGRYASVILSWESIKTHKSYVETLLTMNIIGYCDGGSTEIRPRPDDYAVMFEQDSYQSWCHVPKDVFDAYLGRGAKSGL